MSVYNPLQSCADKPFIHNPPGLVGLANIETQKSHQQFEQSIKNLENSDNWRDRARFNLYFTQKKVWYELALEEILTPTPSKIYTLFISMVSAGSFFILIDSTINYKYRLISAVILVCLSYKPVKVFYKHYQES